MIVIHRRRELPSLRLHWLDSNGDPVSFAAGTWTWTVTVTQDLVDTTLTGVTVAANSNPTVYSGSSSDVPSLTIAAAAGAFDGLAVGPAELTVVGTTSGLDREGRWDVIVK